MHDLIVENPLVQRGKPLTGVRRLMRDVLGMDSDSGAEALPAPASQSRDDLEQDSVADRKTALITGAISGLPLALAHEFALHDFDLILVSDQPDDLDLTAAELLSVHPIRVTTIAQDLRQEHGALEVYRQVAQSGRTVDVLVIDAGIGQSGQFADMPLAGDLDLIHRNVVAVTHLTKLFLSDMLARGNGKILSVGSVSGFRPGPQLAVSHATNAYVVSLSEALADELQGSGVTMTCLCPGDAAKGKPLDSGTMARAGYVGLMAGERVVVPGAANKIMTFTRRMIPLGLHSRSNRQYYEEGEEPLAAGA